MQFEQQKNETYKRLTKKQFINKAEQNSTAVLVSIIVRDNNRLLVRKQNDSACKEGRSIERHSAKI